MKRILIILVVVSLHLLGQSHPWKPRHYVIIDTDAGVDDIKAISMLLASPDIRVLAISVSPGVLSARSGFVKVKSLLNNYYHEGIPVSINTKCRFQSPSLPAALNYKWGDEIPLQSVVPGESIALINEIIASEKNSITMICLGGLSTAADALTQIPGFSKNVKRIIWSAEGLNDKKGFNYNIDSKAAATILGSSIPLTIVKGAGSVRFYDDQLLKKISDVQTVYSQSIVQFFNSETGKNHGYSFTLNDEAIAVYLHNPELFSSDTTARGIEASPGDIGQIREKAIRILKGETVERNQVVREFPVTPSFYFSDLEPFVTDIINNYGMDEWVSGVIANELHRHLGVFAIIGVKMGIRAREYFNTGVDEFTVNSLAGSTPPLSCMNDGLQVSTGATPGHGLLNVINASVSIPSAEFTYLNKKIKITLKPEIGETILNELKEINFVYGLDSDIYWELVRKNSIKYWQKLDRHEIFIIEQI